MVWQTLCSSVVRKKRNAITQPGLLNFGPVDFLQPCGAEKTGEKLYSTVRSLLLIFCAGCIILVNLQHDICKKGFHKLFVFVGIESWLVGVHY